MMSHVPNIFFLIIVVNLLKQEVTKVTSRVYIYSTKILDGYVFVCSCKYLSTQRNVNVWPKMHKHVAVYM